MQVLVTGANGFVGSMVCRKLIEGGAGVRGLVRASSDLSLLDGLPVELVVGSLDDAGSLRAAMLGVRTLFHVAAAVSDWGSLEYFRRVNIEGTRHLLDAAVTRGVRRFVYVSSVAVHSFLGARNMDEDSPQLPTPFPYCQSKREAESLVREYHQRGAIETTIVRPGDVYGPGDRVALLRMAGLLERGLIPLVGKGQYLGALTYVENLADGIILAGSVPGAAGRTYVITDGIEVSWREYFDSLASAIGAPAPRLSIHPTLAWAAASLLETVYRALGIRQRPPITRYLAAHLRADFHFRIDRAQRELGYVPAVGFEEAIRRTAAWYCSLG